MRQNSPPEAGPGLDAWLAEALADARDRGPAASSSLESALSRIGDAARRRSDTLAQTAAGRQEREMSAALKEALAALRDRVEGVESRARERAAAAAADTLAALDGQLAALERKIEADGAKLVAAFAEALVAVKRKVDEIERRIELDRAGRDDAFAAASRRLDAVLARPDPAAALAALSADIGAVTTAVGRLAGRDDLAGVEREVMRLSAMLAGEERAKPADPERLERRFDRLEEALQHLDLTADTAPLEFLLRAIEAKIDRTPPLGADVLDLRLEALRSRLVHDLSAEVSDPAAYSKLLADESQAIAERAAKAVLAQAPVDGLEAMRRGFVDLRTLQASADRRTQAALKSIHGAVEALAARLPDAAAAGAADPLSTERLEAAVARLHRAALDSGEEIAGRAAAPEPARGSGASFSAASSAGPGAVRSTFIAAARRATQAAGAEPPRAAAGEASDGARDAHPTLMDRLRQTFEAPRR